MTKIRESLLAVAHKVAARFPGVPGELVQAQIEGAIAAHAREKIFTNDEAAALIQLRSQLFKSPLKKLSYQSTS